MIDQDGNPKVIDFGLSKDTWGNTRKLNSMVGSKMYMAPEIIRNEQHGLPCDMWSIGIILYTMLSNDYPFNVRNIDEEIMNTPVLYLGERWKDISVEARAFISSCLAKNDCDRLTAFEALNHPWFNKFEQAQIVEPTKLKFDKEVMDALKSYKGMSKLRMAALNVFLHMLEPKDIEPLREIFHSMDSDKTGFINASELHEALKIRGADISDDQPINMVALHKGVFHFIQTF